ncbi:MAG TPA: hypothetical protein VMM55_08785 [Thermohalobaculum sp.]|nr:hypothetical protein [Thermohalobaculum sp.]
MELNLAFDPILDERLLWTLAATAVAAVAFAWLRGLSGWALRALAFAFLVLALAGPQLKREQREGLTTAAFLVIDRSASTGLEDRAEQIGRAAEVLGARLEALSTPETPIELTVVETDEAAGGEARGTRLMTALDDAAARIAPGQIAGAVLLTDGQIHDPERLEDFPAPVHALIAGEEDSYDLRLALGNSPGFGIVGESVKLVLTAEALGQPPAGIGQTLTAEVSIDGGAAQPIQLPRDREVEVEVPIAHGGPNVVDILLPPRDDELTPRNNRVLLSINGVRDRLRVLLVSGEPHPGGRTWRDLLKSDPTVDLIHFTILRPPAKQDGTPVSELSLISFPTRELFLEKIDNFDLIVFDRYRWRGVLATAYLANIANYVREGGAVLVATGPAFAGVQSLAQTPLAEVLPARPSPDVLEQEFLPRVTDLGQRHPVTAGLEAAAGLDDGRPRWGPWGRQIKVIPRSGHIVMKGVDELPLLILDRVEEGRVALLASDHAWLWSRGYEGGGPQADLLRRLAHWLMREPELEEEALVARVEGTRVLVERRTLAEAPPDIVLADPPGEGDARELSLEAVGPGRWQALLEADEEGLWRFSAGELTAVAAVGPPSPAEWENPVASESLVEPLVEASGGRTGWLNDGVPEVRLVAEGRRAHSRRWIGLTERDAYRVTGISLTPLMPAWLAALLIAVTLLAAWRREAR